MLRIKHLLFGTLVVPLGLLLTACGNQKVQTQPVTKLALVKSGQTARPRIWYHVSQAQNQVTANSAVNGIFVLQKGKATTYMLPTGKQPISLKQLAKMSTAEQIRWAKNKDQEAFHTGVTAQQAQTANNIAGIKSDLKQLRRTNGEPSQIKALQQYLKINQAIHDNPSSYAAPIAYPLTAVSQAHSEQFGLKLYPVKTVQYGDANIITASELSLSNYNFNHRIQPDKIAGHYYGGYSSAINAHHYFMLTRVTKHTRIVYDRQKSANIVKTGTTD
ncbi:hypothetical protein ACFP1H_03895 [Secundilactobacillus hailunensis]|uniref:SCP domain-containing protein n=1 Tax=Secundilactobacillus hailunensis TaxID=2559923 RepID=A0ABW1T911_9LACO|nr:hypothetical protein [Secundilactobacillus hailunensis]